MPALIFLKFSKKTVVISILRELERARSVLKERYEVFVMKNKIIILVFVLLIICAGPLRVEASETGVDETTGTTVHVYGYLDERDENSTGAVYEFEWTVTYDINVTFAGYWDMNSDNTFSPTHFMGLIEGSEVSSSYSITYGNFKASVAYSVFSRKAVSGSCVSKRTIYDNGLVSSFDENYGSFSTVINSLDSMSCTGNKLSSDGEIEGTYNISFSFPMFSSKDQALAYLEGKEDIKNATNYESDIAKIAYDLEVPQNLKTKKIEDFFEGSMQFNWEQTDENYKYWETEFYIFQDFKYRDSILIFSWADWQYVDEYYLLKETVDTYKLKWNYDEDIYDKHGCDDNMYNDYPTDYGGIYEPIKDYYYIRNHYFDGEINHYSNWVIVEFDYETGEIKTSFIEKEGSEVEIDDNGKVSIGDSEYVEDSQYTGEDYVGHEEVLGNDLVGWVSDGFGFLGDNGIVQMMSDAFSFLPDFVWVIIGTGLGLFVIIATVKLIF